MSNFIKAIRLILSKLTYLCNKEKFLQTSLLQRFFNSWDIYGS